MARGGRVIFKKTNGNSGGRKRKVRSNDDGDEEEDEEYVLGEDEEVEESESDYESDENSRDLSDEESFEFSDDDEDGEEFKIARSKKKQQRNPKKSRVSDDEMEDLNLSVPKKSGRGRQRKQESRDSDFELDDEDDDDEDFSPDEDDFDEDEVSIFSRRKVGVKNVRSKVTKRKGTTKRSRVSVPARKRRKTMIKGSGDDFIVKGRVSGEREQTVSKKGRKKKPDSDSMDSDFVISDDDFVEKDLVAITKCRKNSNKVKKAVRCKGQRQKRSVEDSEPSDSDFVISNGDGDGDGDEVDDLHMKNQVILDKQQKKGHKVNKTAGSKGRRKKIALEDSEPSDSDYVISDDDEDSDDEELKDQFMLEKQQKKSHQVILDKQQKKGNKVKTTAGSKGRRRKIALEDSEQSDSDFVISDDDYEDGDDDDDEDVKDQFMLEKQQKKSNKVKKAAGSRGRKKRSVEDSESSDFDFMISDDDDDDEFDVKDQLMVYKQQVNYKKEKAVSFNKGRRRKRSSDLGLSDSDYLISEEDDEFVLKDQVVLDELRKKSKKVRKRRTEPLGRRRSSSLVDSNSESFDFDDVISEEEVRDLRIGWHSNQEQPKRITAGKREEKGNEKKAKTDSGKQVCGICLSEEKKSVVQGLLNCCFHYFCFACIMEWSKVESRCPVCKRRFETITKSGSLEPGFRMTGAVIRVQKRDQVYQPSEEELRGMLDPYEHVVCMECQQGRDDNLMLLCDICDSSAHTYCVGLGREVPEGNWYCECCRSASDGQDQMSGVAVPDQERSQLTSACVSTNSPRPASMFGLSSSLRIDLNSSPRDFPGEEFVSSPIFGTGASTVSGRRQIRQRIHVILSTNRQRQTSAGTNMFHSNSASDIAHNGNALPVSDTRNPLSSVSSFEQWQQNPTPFFHSHPNLAPCMFTEGSSLRHVDGAKEEVQHMVKSHLKNLSRNRILERSAFKEIARKSTHTILATCGIEHHRSMVSASVEPPDNCTHDSGDGPAHLLKGCCSSCFSSFVKDVVQRLINTTTAA